MQKFKILHIIPSLRKGGAERLVIDICNELNNYSNIEAKLVVLENTDDYSALQKKFEIIYCNSQVIPSLTGKKHVNISDFENVVKSFKPDVIHSHLFIAELVSREKVFPNVKYVSHCHDNMKQFKHLTFNTFKKKELITNYYERYLLFKKYKECNNKFIAISEDCQSYFNKNLTKKLKNITLLYNAIDFNRFNKAFNPVKPDGAINLVNVGSLVDKKNQIFLVDVAEVLISKGFNVKIDLLGDGYCKNKIQDKINLKKLNNKVFLRGNVDSTEEYLSKSHIYVHSAIYEPFGLVLLEAMAAGLPIVSLNGKGNVNLIKNGFNGFMLNNSNAIEFAEKIIEIYKNQNLYHKMSCNSIEFAKKYDIKEYVEKLIEIYKK